MCLLQGGDPEYYDKTYSELGVDKKAMKPQTKIVAILLRCFRFFATRFNNLLTVNDWIQLYKVLVEASMIDVTTWTHKSLPLSFH